VVDGAGIHDELVVAQKRRHLVAGRTAMKWVIVSVSMTSIKEKPRQSHRGLSHFCRSLRAAEAHQNRKPGWNL
jgi:hypothetical protein